MLVFLHGTTTIKRVLKNMQKSHKNQPWKLKRNITFIAAVQTMLLYSSENQIFLSANVVGYDCVFKRCHVWVLGTKLTNCFRCKPMLKLILLTDQMLKTSVYKGLAMFVLIQLSVRSTRKCLVLVVKPVFVQHSPRSGNYPCSGYKQRIMFRNVWLIWMWFIKNKCM